MSELNYTKCGNDSDFLGDLFEENSDIRYFLADNKTFFCYTLEDLKGMVLNSNSEG